MRLLCAALAAAFVVVPFGATAQNPGAGRFGVPDQTTASRLPPGLDTTPITVVVFLAGDSVATAQETAGRRLSRDEKDHVKRQRATDQNAIRSQIEAAGGTILTAFQSAVNGIKVRIARNKVFALGKIAGVTDVKGVNRYERDNTVGVPRVQAPAVWSGLPAFRGEGIKVAIIDTGIDYTHANFGGPGTTAAYDAAFATGTLPANPALFGPGAPRVKGGTDLVGDDYDADVSTSVPKPDPNPLDCNLDVGHGSHVAGTAAGNGVLANGTTYNGPYDSTTYSNSFRIGPGVAPKADLYAIRVFGCFGTTDVVVEALDWAVDHDMDVVNMSLGSSYGTADSADAVASNNAVKAGVVVVASAGNSGNAPYITGSPATATRVVSVAAATTPATIPFGNMALPAAGGDPARVVSAQNSNSASYASPLNGTVKVVRTSTNGVSLGCTVAAFQANGGVAGMIAVVQRGTCARVAKAIYGQQAGAIAVIMVNNSSALPPYEGTIFQNPDTGDYYDVTIPFFGVKGTVGTATSDGAKVVLRDGMPISIAVGASQQSGIASFSSSGPRNLDSALKPDVTAPGSPTISTYVGSGNRQESLSGTSMASPHVAGVAALVQQAHPKWKPDRVKAAIVNGGNPADIAGYLTRLSGSGFVNANASAHTQVTAAVEGGGTAASFGFAQLDKDYSGSRTITLRNDGKKDATFNVSTSVKQGSPHSVSVNKAQVKVRAGEDTDVKVSLSVPAATAGNSDDFREVAGLVAFTPASPADNGGIALRVPYYFVPRVSSNVSAKLAGNLKGNNPTGNVSLSNKGSPIAATADFYSWGLKGAGEGESEDHAPFRLNAAGAQSWDDGTGNQVVVIAINTSDAWSSASTREFDVYVDTDGDGVPDYAVVGIDLGYITTGSFSGQMASVVFNLKTGAGNIDYLAYAPTDSSTILLPFDAARLKLSPGSPRFAYTIEAFDYDNNTSDAFTKWAKYNAFGSAITDGQYATLAPNATSSVPFAVNSAEYKLTPARGLMVVTQDNKNGSSEANLVEIEVEDGK
jgi:minor extracellular serine protease Vpr